MRTYAFRIVNVFTVAGDRFSGNPLCVVEDARAMTDGEMQAFARQMNLSETTFVLPPEMVGADARVRIFTPGFEMPFAGHPTLGTAFVVAAGRAQLAFEMRAGLVRVEAGADDRFTLRTARGPKTRPVAATRAELAAMLGLAEAAIAGEPRWVDTGVEQLVIPLAREADVRAVRPVPALLERHGYSESRDEAMAYVVAPADAGDHLVVRFFFTSQGAVLEDPATGSACANLGGYHLAMERPLPYRATLHQGDAVARPSRLALAVTADGAIEVSGQVIELGRGTFEI